jgi:hypothetical protein
MADLKIIKNRPLRVKLIDLPDEAQAVAHIRDEKYMQMTIYGYDSKEQPVQFVAPFAFNSEASRDEAFNNEEKLRDFANAVFITQMANIDPELNTENFKQV